MHPLFMPTVIPYQGSKRLLAPEILTYVPQRIDGTFYEPFAGSAAMSLAVAATARVSHVAISDILEPLAGIWTLVVERPNELAAAYERLWVNQHDDPRSAYDRIRSEFNESHDPVKLLYLIARCVKNSVRFNPAGKFNQSPDNRRLGMRPPRMRQQIFKAHALLAGKASAKACDYADAIRTAGPNDFVYMDPPYQGVSNGKDRRYAQTLDLGRLVETLVALNGRDVPYIVSFDGSCGNRKYGDALPTSLQLTRIFLHAGRSSQATLLGRDETTVESIYISPALQRRLAASTQQAGETGATQLQLIVG